MAGHRRLSFEMGQAHSDELLIRASAQIFVKCAATTVKWPANASPVEFLEAVSENNHKQSFRHHVLLFTWSQQKDSEPIDSTKLQIGRR